MNTSIAGFAHGQGQRIDNNLPQAAFYTDGGRSEAVAGAEASVYVDRIDLYC